MNKVFEKILDIIFPRKCMVCGELFPYNAKDIGICNECLNIFKRPSGNTCTKCGRQLRPDKEHCYSCDKYIHGKLYKDNKYYFINNFPIFIYNEFTKISIFELKYSKKMYTVDGFRTIIKKSISSYDFSKIDFIAPVPMHIKKEKERGFNQAKIFAKIISDLANVEYDDTTIIRNKNTTVQSNKTLKERHENLENCFEVIKNDSIKDKTILLVDDIFTSGSTINMCAKEFMEKGAKAVYSMTVSITSEKYDE